MQLNSSDACAALRIDRLKQSGRLLITMLSAMQTINLFFSKKP